MRGDSATARTEHSTDQLCSPPGIEISPFSASALARPLLTQNAPAFMHIIIGRPGNRLGLRPIRHSPFFPFGDCWSLRTLFTLCATDLHGDPTSV